MKDSIKKILRIIGVVFACILALPFLIAVVVSLTRPIFESPNCYQFGYERVDVFLAGTKFDIVNRLPGEGSDFPESENYFSRGLPKKDKVTIKDYSFFLQCEDLKYAERIRVVRFSVIDTDIFFDKRKLGSGDPGDPVVISGGIIPWSVYQEHRASGYKASWMVDPARTKKGDDRKGRKHKIDAFKIDWLKDEPLGEAEFVGLWRGGWLFRSKNPDQYVWID